MVLTFYFMFSQALHMSSLSFNISKAANLFDSIICYCFLKSIVCYCFLTSSSFAFLRFNHSISKSVLLCTYCQTFLNFCNHQIVIITFGSPERSYIKYTQKPSPVYQYVINLVVSLPIRRSPGVSVNVLVQEHHALNN